MIKLCKKFTNNEKINSKIKLSNNSSLVIVIFVILKFRNIPNIHSVVPNFDPDTNIVVTYLDLRYLCSVSDFFTMIRTDKTRNIT